MNRSQILRASVAFVWLATGIAVLHPAYRVVGEAYLARLHLGPWAMWAACAAEVVLGIVVLLVPPRPWLTGLQVGAIAFFTVTLAVLDPWLLVHPFGVLTKNLPMLAVIAALQMEARDVAPRLTGWVLRAGAAVIWITEGLFPKILFQQESERQVVAHSGLVPIDPSVFLLGMGAAQVLAGIAVLTLPERPRRILLYALAAALVILPALVSWQDPTLWVHPFGPMTKNVPILAATLVLAAGVNSPREPGPT